MALLLADASPLIGFICSQQHNILIAVAVEHFDGEIQVAHQVDIEVERNLPGKGMRATYAWMKNTNKVVKVLPDPAITDEVAGIAADMVTVDPARPTFTKDLGEALTVAHAVVSKNAGDDPTVLMDDTGGIKWANAKKVAHIDTVWIFDAAINLGLITTKADLSKAYEAVGHHAWLPSLATTGLLGKIS